VGLQTAIAAVLLESGVFPGETQVKIPLGKFSEKMQNILPQKSNKKLKTIPYFQSC
jgi:hypothetical protein